MDLEGVVRTLATDDQLVDLVRLPARPARFATLARPLPAAVADRLPPGGLWTHQATAIDLARDQRSVVIVTGTASGKSLCFQVPIGEAAGGVDADGGPAPVGTALLVYPTKALAQDQLRALSALELPGVVAACYDGDSSPEERAWARRHATVLLTNPDMLHAGLLPAHGRHADLLGRLRYVVVDELHTYRGVFGTHVAHLLRRLRRICAHYGSAPTFVFSSATLGQAERLASSLCGLPVTAVADDGSPQGERLLALWNPPLADPSRGARRSAHGETASLIAGLVANGHRTVAFCRSRRGTEVVAAAAQRLVPDALAAAIRPYRGGYLPEERRHIEGELFGGDLAAVVATSALELGIDVGSLDACVLDGFPGTVASMWQQIGRAGRSTRPSLATLVAGSDQLDQWFMAHPDEVLSRPPEPAIINPDNPEVLDPHLACAAYELPLSDADTEWWGDGLDDGVRRLVQDDLLRVRDGRAWWAARGAPATRMGLRGGWAEEVAIVDHDLRLIGTVDGIRALSTVHPGAVYLHQGQTWEVERLDLTERVAMVSPASGDEYTQVRSHADIRILEDEATTTLDGGGATLHLGSVEVSEQVTGYQRRDAATGAARGTVPLDLPPTRLVTRAFWWIIDPMALFAAGLEAEAWPGTLHAIEHAAIGLLPLFTICDRWDVGGVSTPLQADTGRPTIVIYDGYPGGAGIAELGYAAGISHLDATRQAIAGCPCAQGCPSCVQSPKCGNLNEPLDKAGAVALLDLLLGVGDS